MGGSCLLWGPLLGSAPSLIAQLGACARQRGCWVPPLSAAYGVMPLLNWRSAHLHPTPTPAPTLAQELVPRATLQRPHHH